jgi:hypothetical protein
MVCKAEPAIGAGLAGRLARQPAIRDVHAQAARAGCESLSVALAMVLLQAGSRFANQLFKRCMPSGDTKTRQRNVQFYLNQYATYEFYEVL